MASDCRISSLHARASQSTRTSASGEMKGMSPRPERMEDAPADLNAKATVEDNDPKRPPGVDKWGPPPVRR